MPGNIKSPVRMGLCSAAFYAGSALAALPLLVGLLRRSRAEQVANLFLHRQMEMLKWCAITCEINGLHHIPAGPVLFAAQHESTWETLHFTRILGNPAMFAKSELFRLPLIGWVARRMGHIPLARNGSLDGIRDSLRQGADQARQGRSLLIFPSGSRRATGKIHAGVGVLYQLAGLTVVPVRLSSGHCWPARGWPLRPGVIRVDICAPIPAGLPRDQMLALLKTTLADGQKTAPAPRP